MSMLGGRSGSDGRAVPAAVHQYPFPCNVSGLAGAEEGDRAPDLLRRAMTFRRDAAGGLDPFGNAVVCDTVFLLKISAHCICHNIARRDGVDRSEEHTSDLQSLMRISYAVFCLKKPKHTHSHVKK